MSLSSAIPSLVVTVGAAMALELRRLSEAQAAVAEHRSVRNSPRGAGHEDSSTS